MPKNQVAPDNSSSVYSVSGRQVTPAPGASGRTANFSATNSDTGSKLSTNNGGGLRKFTGTNGDVRIPLHPSEPRGDDARGRSAESGH